MSYAHLLPAAHAAVDLAVEIFHSRAPGHITAKGDRDMATDVDYAIEREIRAFLAKETPDIDLLGEEDGHSGTGDRLMWALDPIDGTANYLHGSPLCAISLALFDGETAVLGLIDMPLINHRRYAAVHGEGATRDGAPITVSTTDQLHDAIVTIGDYAVGRNAARRNKHRLTITRRLAEQAQRVRMHGSAAIDLALLAEGAVDATMIMSNNPWDTAAGVILVQEAGGQVRDTDGTPHNRESTATIAANPRLIPQVLDLAS